MVGSRLDVYDICFDKNECPKVSNLSYGSTWGLSSEGNVYRMGTTACLKLSEKSVVMML